MRFFHCFPIELISIIAPVIHRRWRRAYAQHVCFSLLLGDERKGTLSFG